MDETKNKSIADTFNSRIRSPWLWIIFAVTIGVTILFYLSQKPQIIMYSRYIKTLQEYQLQESYAMRSLDKVRLGFGADSMRIQMYTMTLREIAVSFSREMDEKAKAYIQVPPYSMVTHFENEVLAKVSAMRRYFTNRETWLKKLDAINANVIHTQKAGQYELQKLLDSARVGYPVMLDTTKILINDNTLKSEIISLLQENETLSQIFARFNNQVASVYCEDLIQFFLQKNLDEISLKSRIPMVFYFLTLVLMLSTFFFIFKSRQ